MEITSITSLLSPLKEWFTAISAERVRREERYQEALTALYLALNETRIYLGSLERKWQADEKSTEERRNYETEAKLSRLWTAASLKLKPFNRDLAERCLMKGDYWAIPETWDGADIKSARIGIDQMFKAARKLLSA